MERPGPHLPPLPPRPVDGHKGTFGTVLVIGGCDPGEQVMIGAPALAATAALRAGAGLVKLAMPASIISQGIGIAPSATGIALPQLPDGSPDPSGIATVLDRAIQSARVSAVAIGPGWGIGPQQQQILMRLTAGCECPIVVDADGLNNLAATPQFWSDLSAPLVLTPHPGEYRRLAAALRIKADATASSEARRDAARQLAARLGCVVVLKGASTVVSDGQREWVSSARTACLATAGTGDVLTGVIAGLVGQHFKPYLGPLTPQQQGGAGLFDLACWGVAIHAQAGLRWQELHGDAGLLAQDLLDLIPSVFTDLRNASSEEVKDDRRGSEA